MWCQRRLPPSRAAPMMPRLTESRHRVPAARRAGTFLWKRAAVVRLRRGRGMQGERGANKTNTACVAADRTFKLNKSNYGFAAFQRMAKHEGPDGFPASEGLNLSCGWDEASWLAILCTTINHYLKQNVDLRRFMHALVWDGAAGGCKAHSRLFPSLPAPIDLRHVVGGVKDLPNSVAGGKDWADFVAGCVQCSALNEPTTPRFSLFWNQTTVDLLAQGKDALVKHIRDYLLIWNDKARPWSSKRKCGLARPWSGQKRSVKSPMSVCTAHPPLAFSTL